MEKNPETGDSVMTSTTEEDVTTDTSATEEEVITDITDPRVQVFANLKDSKAHAREGVFIAEGPEVRRGLAGSFYHCERSPPVLPHFWPFAAG
jgi:hypothetical protein